MQIAITGATGFIGKRLVQYYEDVGAVVHILSRKASPNINANTRVFNFDLANCSPEDLVPFVNGCDILYHCAAELRDDSNMVQVNEMGTQKLFDAAKGRIGRWVQLSSVGVYGRPRFGLVDENYIPDPQNKYEKSKLAADEWLWKQSKQSKVELVILRPSTVFANDMPNQSLSQLFRAVQHGRFFYIGSKQAQLNYVHADDVLAALVLCGHHARAAGEVFIVSEHMRMVDFIDVVVSQLHCRNPFLIMPEWGVRGIAKLFCWIPHFPLTASRIDALTSRCIFLEGHIKQQLGYLPTVSLREGFLKFSTKFIEGK